MEIILIKKAFRKLGEICLLLISQFFLFIIAMICYFIQHKIIGTLIIILMVILLSDMLITMVEFIKLVSRMKHNGKQQL